MQDTLYDSRTDEPLTPEDLGISEHEYADALANAVEASDEAGRPVHIRAGRKIVYVK